MTSAADICNRALGEIGARTTISNFNTETSPAAVACLMNYTPLRQQLLRTAPWGFARKTVTLTTLGLATDDPPAAPYPWLVKYAYPADCQKMRYILPPPFATDASAPDVSSQLIVPWCPPSRQWRYLVSLDDTVSPARRVIVSNVLSAYAVYTADVEDPGLWDALFTDAMVMALAFKLVIPLSGNVGMKQGYAALAKDAITQARTADGNEAIPTTDHVVDWMAARGVYNPVYGAGDGGFGSIGVWNCTYDQMSWGM